ncbi:hypothetical protein V6615_06400 [Oscillospiraceae bacterium PP1C4]
MPTKILLKRGLKSNLPILNAGEAAFTTDTKELYIGSGTDNYSMSPSGVNMIVNGNFQISLTDEDGTYQSRVVTPGQGTYLYGNFYLSNAAGAAGNITVTRTYTNGFITLVCTNAIPTLEYRERLPVYKSSASGYSVAQPNLSQYLTLSYDASNSTGSSVTVQSGTPTSLGSLLIPSTSKRIAYTFQMTSCTNGYMSIILLKMTSSFNGSFTVGNFKLEQGLYSTKYTPNPTSYDLSCLNQVYQWFSYMSTPAAIDADYLYVVIPTSLAPYSSSAPPYRTALISTSIKYYNNYTLITGFTTTATYLSAYRYIGINCYKQNHGLTTATITVQGYLDLRP